MAKNHLINIFLIYYVSTLLVDLSIKSETTKTGVTRVEQIDSLELIEQRLFNNKENAIILFHMDWCGHW